MRAMRGHVSGEPLVLDDVPVPTPGSGETLVRVTYAAVNPLDVSIARGRIGTAGPLPRVAGCEGAGVTADGRRVVVRGAGLGMVRDGTFAEHVAVPDEALTEIPGEVSDALAATVGVAGVTALDILDLGGVERETSVLVLGGSGGVSSFAIPLALMRGARVLVQTRSQAGADRLGAEADEVLVTDADTLADSVRAVASEGVDVVLDGLAGEFTTAALEALKPGGRLVLYGASSGPSFVTPARSLYAANKALLGYGGLGLPAERVARSLQRVLDHIAAGVLTPQIAHELPLEEANEAYSRIAAGQAAGKLVLRV